MAVPPSVRDKGPSLIPFSVTEFLGSEGVARRILHYRNRQRIFSQGDFGETVLYIQKGKVRISVVNPRGREAVLAVQGPGGFIGEQCLAAQPLRTATATAMAATSVLAIEKGEMIRILHAQSSFSECFIAHMLQRSIRSEQDLTDQLFNSIERRLARTILLLAGHGSDDKPARTIGNVSQEMLAEMIGSTRPRVNFFMNKFRKLGLINYDAKTLTVNDSLVRFVLS
jgi:CRP/FNR family transcriptional regulator, cyclic AMP receptor protein